MPTRGHDRDKEAAAFERMASATLELRRRHFRETTPGERIEEAFALNELANELQKGVLRARARK